MNRANAKHHLLAAGRASGAPTLGSFGPDMRRARELLERGERGVVLEYSRTLRELLVQR